MILLSLFILMQVQEIRQPDGPQIGVRDIEQKKSVQIALVCRPRRSSCEPQIGQKGQGSDKLSDGVLHECLWAAS
jgi:hypothetical protein